VIATLNRYYIPVYISNEDYEGKEVAVSAEEKKAYLKIYHEALKEKRSAGSVCVYLVGPDGKGLASIIVSDAAQGDKLQKLLDATVARLGTPEGKPVIAPAAQAPAPKADKGDVVLHLVSRRDSRGSWGEFPSENWIVLKPADAAKLLPADEASKAWDIDASTATKILTHFYPQVETCDYARETTADSPHRHRVEQVALRGKIVSNEGGRARARLDGSIRFKHTFYPGRDDNNFATSTVVGYLDFDVKTRALATLRLVTTTATYGKEGFSVAVEGGKASVDSPKGAK
jgi:hypothetical protein